MSNNKILRTVITGWLLMQLPVELSAQSIHITNGAKLVMNGPVNLVLNDMSFTNDGAVTAGNSTIQLTGITTATIGGSQISSLAGLTINKSSSSVQLSQNIIVNGTLAFNNGNLLLNAHTIDLGATGIISGETNDHSITGANGGTVTVTRNIGAPNAVNPGNIGAELTSTLNMGAVTITRSHLPQELPDGGFSIGRSYFISGGKIKIPTINAQLRFFYLDTELGDNDEGSLTVWTNSGIGAFLTSIGKDGSDLKNNWVLKNNLDELGNFTLASGGDISILNSAAKLNKHAGADNAVASTIKDAARAYPNPALNTFNLELTSSQSKKVMVNLVDQTGRVLQQKEVSCQPGTNIISFNMGSYPAGVYFVSFKNSVLKNIKIIKE